MKSDLFQFYGHTVLITCTPRPPIHYQQGRNFHPISSVGGPRLAGDSHGAGPHITEAPSLSSTLHSSVQFSSVQLLRRIRLFATPWTAACQASLSITNSQSLLKLMPIESVMPSSHPVLCCPLLLPPIPPSIRIFSNESTLHMR